MLRFLLNLLWLITTGFWMALGYALAGVVCAILVVTFPFAVASFRIAGFVLWPFGRALVRKPEAGAASTVLNVVWIIIAGWWLALGHLTAALGLAVTIIGIPFAWAHLKLIPASVLPFGHQIEESDRLFPTVVPGYAVRG
jgi:uncharacterized membrane protein YccF (DUF307 family)